METTLCTPDLCVSIPASSLSVSLLAAWNTLGACGDVESKVKLVLTMGFSKSDTSVYKDLTELWLRCDANCSNWVPRVLNYLNCLKQGERCASQQKTQWKPKTINLNQTLLFNSFNANNEEIRPAMYLVNMAFYIIVNTQFSLHK